MKTKRKLWWTLVWAGALSLLTPLGGNSAAGAERRESGRYGGAEYHPHGGRVESPGIVTPGAGVTPGVGGGAPGVGAGARGAGVAPGVGVGTRGVGALPHGYVYKVPAGWTKVYYGGYWCACVNGVHYRPIYYQGAIVYVVVT